MNPYLLAFSIYALLITPITLHISVRVGRQVRYRLRVQAAGLPFLRKIKEPQPQEEHTVHEEDVARTLSEPWIWPALRAIGLKRLRRALHAVHLESAYLHVRFSFDDAAVTRRCKPCCGRWPARGPCPGRWMGAWRWISGPRVRKFSQAA